MGAVHALIARIRILEVVITKKKKGCNFYDACIIYLLQIMLFLHSFLLYSYYFL